MAKQQSFAEKAAKKKKKDLSTYVKYIKSVKSEKTGYWRFNEQMIEVKTGENLDGALKRMDEVTQVFNMEIPVIEAAADVDTVDQDGADEPKDHEQAADDKVQEESGDVVAEESVTEVSEPAAAEQAEAEPELKRMIQRLRKMIKKVALQRVKKLLSKKKMMQMKQQNQPQRSLEQSLRNRMKMPMHQEKTRQPKPTSPLNLYHTLL